MLSSFPTAGLEFAGSEFFAFLPLPGLKRRAENMIVLCPGNGTGAALELVSTRALSSAPVPLLYTLWVPGSMEFVKLQRDIANVKGTRKETSGLFES